MSLNDLRNAYKGFFLGTEAGRQFMKTLEEKHADNLRKAENDTDLNYLARAKGNSEALALITNVLSTEDKPKE